MPCPYSMITGDFLDRLMELSVRFYRLHLLEINVYSLPNGEYSISESTCNFNKFKKNSRLLPFQMNMSTDYNSALEYTVGAILIITSIFGTLLNVVSFSYFSFLKTRNKNSEFFKKLYMSITVNDILISLTLFPFIEAIFSENRQGILASNHPFCVITFVGWFLLSQNSVILLALLSLTRLLLLRNPNRVFIPNIAFIIPLAAFLIFLIIWSVPIATGDLYIFYNPNYIECSFNSFSMQNDSRPVSIGDQVGAIVVVTMYNSIASSVFNIVSISFVMSLVKLRKTSQVATRLGGKADKQREAAKTVAIVTFVYILCNVPFMLVMMYVLIDVIKNPAEENTTVADIRARYFTQIFGQNNTLMNQYVCILANKIAVSLNSLMNPFVYYFRIDGFRKFVSRAWNRGENNSGSTTSETSGPL